MSDNAAPSVPGPSWVAVGSHPGHIAADKPAAGTEAAGTVGTAADIEVADIAGTEAAEEPAEDMTPVGYTWAAPLQ